MHGSHARRLPLAVAALLFCTAPASATTPVFRDITLEAGITHRHDYVEQSISSRHMFLAGAAASDYDGDGWVDLYVIRGSIGSNILYRNNGDGTFEDVSAAAGVSVNGDMASGPLFLDANGDGVLDLFVAGTRGTPNRFFIANGDGTFTDRIDASGIPDLLETFSASAGDYDRDGDLDLFLAHWEIPMAVSHLWRNNGHGVFTCVDTAAGIHAIGNGRYDYSFTANFTDLNGDRWPDIVMAGDFKTSRVFINRRDGTFADATTPVISDENGMGAAVGDYDNDGDIDWFVSSIFDASEVPNGGAWGFTGNRLYRNRGDGSFDDVTGATGVREGGWGWGASFADFDNDGWLDLYHVNGWPSEVETFLEDPSRLFMNDGHGGFVESSNDAGIASTAQGRGVICFDYDRDGDIDVFVSNYRDAPALFRNDSAPGNWLSMSLRGRVRNTDAIGASVRIESGDLVQVREVMCGNNYLSQNPAEIHVGLGAHDRADRIVINWPNGSRTSVADVAAGQSLSLDEPPTPARTPGPVRIVSAHPNPFNAEVTLRFEGASAGATISIFDVAGRHVRDLAMTNTGVVGWDGHDGRGTPAPAGVYWFRIRDGGAREARRVVLIR